MRTHTYFYQALCFIILATGCTMRNVDQNKLPADSLSLKSDPTVSQTTPKESITGDFNGDGKKEQAWVVRPALTKDSMACESGCQCSINFSDSNITSIKINDAADVMLSNNGDLNQNGTDELGIWPQMLAGCWSYYHVYSLSNKKWKEVVAPIPVHCNQMDDTEPIVKTDSTQKAHILIRYSENSGAEINTKTRSVAALQP